MKNLSKNEIWVRFAVACYQPGNVSYCSSLSEKANSAAMGADELFKEYLKRFPEEKEKTLLKEGL